jgi:uncharacterized membrane protein YraQ (UPF0718 family)
MSNIAIIYISICAVVSLISFIFNRDKTIAGFKKGLNMFKNLLPPFLTILIAISVLLYIIPPNIISQYMGPDSGASGVIFSAVVGSLVMIPAMIAYPISANLLQHGASYGVVATFMTSLMMVGVVTLPLEIQYFGKSVAILRKSLNFAAAIIIGVVIGLVL